MRCPNGECVNFVSQCHLQEYLCDDGSYCDKSSSLVKPIRCWNNECVASLRECPMTTGCPFDAPYRCITGECVLVRHCLVSSFRTHHNVCLLFVMRHPFSVRMVSVLHHWTNASQRSYVDYQSLSVVVVAIVELTMSIQVYLFVRTSFHSLSSKYFLILSVFHSVFVF